MSSLFPRLRLLAEYAPLLARAQDLTETTDHHKRALIVMDALMWLAKRSDNKIDDEVIELVIAVLATEEGKRLFNYTVDAITEALKQND